MAYRQDGFDVLAGDHYFKVAQIGGKWVAREWYGPTAGFGESIDSFSTLRDAKEYLEDSYEA